jgi:uncharacterized protein
MLYFLTLTQRCNLACTYCGSSEELDIEDLVDPLDCKYQVDALDKLTTPLKDEQEPMAICFYGGEPLLQLRQIKKVLAQHEGKATKFVLQTNGTKLNRTPTKVVNRMDCILISVDGGEKVTDTNRGAGTWRQAIDNGFLIRKNGFTGDLIARMTVSHVSGDIYQDVKDLFDLGIFDHVHWQLDAQWSTPMYAGYEDRGGFLKWRDEVYNPSITKLATYFRDTLLNDKRLLGVAPFLPLLHTLITGDKATLRCGSGRDAFNVRTGGGISACPIAPDSDLRYDLAHINDADFTPETVRDSIKIGGPCLTCEVKDVCGGRCLYANKTMWWGEEGFLSVCQTVKHLIQCMRVIQPDVESAIAQGIIELEDLNYPKYNNSVEVIP